MNTPSDIFTTPRLMIRRARSQDATFLYRFLTQPASHNAPAPGWPSTAAPAAGWMISSNRSTAA